MEEEDEATAPNGVGAAEPALTKTVSRCPSLAVMSATSASMSASFDAVTDDGPGRVP